MSKDNILAGKASEFRTKIRAMAKVERSLYVIMEVAKKLKLKHDGKDVSERPVYTIYLNVNESNLPMPANMYNPVFMFERGNRTVETAAGTGITDHGDKYVGCPSPGQYFTLPDYDNKINADAVEVREVMVETGGVPASEKATQYLIGQYYLTSAFLQTFTDPVKADAFIVAVKTELRQFLSDLQRFLDTHPDMAKWGGYEHHAVTKGATMEARLVEGDGSFASFTEGNIKKH
jgi:hypothetical protein